MYRRQSKCSPGLPLGVCFVSWLIRDLQIYLNGFWNRGIRPKAGKDSQKDGGEKYEDPALTTAALTMPRRLRAFTLPSQPRPPMSAIQPFAAAVAQMPKPALGHSRNLCAVRKCGRTIPRPPPLPADSAVNDMHRLTVHAGRAGGSLIAARLRK